MGADSRKDDKEELAKELRNLGSALRDLRQKAELSVRGLAQKLGISPTIISRIESNQIKRKPSQDQLNKMAEALDEYADEFRKKAGIVPPKTQAILAKSQGFASTLESIHERFDELLQSKGLSDEQIESVMEQATERTILDVVNGREPIDIELGAVSEQMLSQHLDAGHQVLDVNADMSSGESHQVAEAPSKYLAKNRDAFLPDSLSSRKGRARSKRRPPSRPLSIDAGDASIVMTRTITEQERLELEAIAKVIAQLLAK